VRFELEAEKILFESLSLLLVSHMKSLATLLSLSVCLIALHAAPVSLFDGKTLDGWEGETEKTWRVQDGMIVGGSLSETVPRNEFLCTKKRYKNFKFQVKVKLEGSEGEINAGIQFRSERRPNHHEVIGYQADMASNPTYWGSLYDESRRDKMLATTPEEITKKALKPTDWNDYEILCEGKRIQLFINGFKTIEYTETDPAIPETGIIGLQIHGGGKALVRYKDISIEELP